MVVAFIAVFIVWFLWLTFFLLRTVVHYKRLTKGIDKKDLKTILDKLLSEAKSLKEDEEKLSQRLSTLEKEKVNYIQKIGFTRFNPFSDTGGNQSFSLALLDEEENGIVLSSLHSRGSTRLYAKGVSKGKGKPISLSKEELETIKKAK